MPKPRTSAAVKNKYNAKNYERIELVVRRGKKELVKQAAKDAGMSTNEYILTALGDVMGCDLMVADPADEPEEPEE